MTALLCGWVAADMKSRHHDYKMTLCRATVREVVGSSIPDGPTLRVFKELSSEYCLCNDTCEWLDSLVFLEDDKL